MGYGGGVGRVRGKWEVKPAGIGGGVGEPGQAEVRLRGALWGAGPRLRKSYCGRMGIRFNRRLKVTFVLPKTLCVVGLPYWRRWLPEAMESVRRGSRSSEQG